MSHEEASKTALTPNSPRLIVMTRVPEAGRVKTRLIPALGDEGAAALHAALLRKTLDMATRHVGQSSVKLEVRFTGEGVESLQALDARRVVDWRAQHEGDLGARLHGAIAEAFREGATAVVVIGTDCPDLSPEILDRAWDSLRRHDVVLGPAEDGGYYLIGLQRADMTLFTGIDWGTERVLRQTLERCRDARKSHALLPVLRDIDEAEDLIVCRRFETEFADCLPRARAGLLSVVVPTLNEAEQLESTLAPVLCEPECEVIVADGGSTDGTVEIARRLGCKIVPASRGRGRQMNAGAAQASGERLLFLHADTRLPPNFREELSQVLDGGAVVGGALAGAFRLSIEEANWSLRLVAWGANLRSSLGQLPYGDQGLFLRSRDFFRMGGFPNWPLMEDNEFSRRLRREGAIRLTRSAVRTSSRRWRKLGVWRTTLINQLCVAGLWLGVSPERLAEWYAARTGRGPHRLATNRAAIWWLTAALMTLAVVAARLLTATPPVADARHNRVALERMMQENRDAFPDVPEIDVASLVERMRDEQAVLVDVRDAEERTVSIIPGSISAAELESSGISARGRPIVCYCTVGYRSARSAREWRQRGVDAVNFNGGLVAWCQAGGKLTTSDGRDTTRVHVYGPRWNLLPPEYVPVTRSSP